MAWLFCQIKTSLYENFALCSTNIILKVICLKISENIWKVCEKNPVGHKSTFKFCQMEYFEKLNIDNAKVNYVEFVGPLVILIEAPVT